MYFKQFYLGCLAHASYLIADEETRAAVVVDPQRDIDQYLQECQDKGWRIEHVVLTHFHADFLAGHLELKAKTGAKIYLGKAATSHAQYEFVPLGEGDKIKLGQVCLQAMETPGHTLESICLVVYENAQAEKNGAPHAVLTGDTLFVGDVGRPDLLVSVGISAEDLASLLYDSLHSKILRLPDSTLVYPAHGAGSMCGKSLGTERYTTIGEQKKFNYALKQPNKEAFIKAVTADQSQAPLYFGYNASLNKQERGVLDESLKLSLKPIGLEEVLVFLEQGGLVLDSRDPADFAKLHLRGSMNIGLGGKYATWAGTLIEPGTKILIVADAGKEEESALRLGRIGFDSVVGYLEGGSATLVQADKTQVASFKRISAEELKAFLAQDPKYTVVDVRAESEWESKHIPSSLNLPLDKLASRCEAISREKPFVVHCQSGYRSVIALSILEHQGFDNLVDMKGGIQAWLEDGKDVVSCAKQT